MSEYEPDDLNPKEVRSRLDDLMASFGYSVLRADTSEDDIENEIERVAAWSEAEKEGQTESPREKANHYRKILDSLNPWEEGLIHGIYEAGINAISCGRTRL